MRERAVTQSIGCTANAVPIYQGHPRAPLPKGAGPEQSLARRRTQSAVIQRLALRSVLWGDPGCA